MLKYINFRVFLSLSVFMGKPNYVALNDGVKLQQNGKENVAFLNGLLHTFVIDGILA